jgi:hypothetical protein
MIERSDRKLINIVLLTFLMALLIVSITFYHVMVLYAGSSKSSDIIMSDTQYQHLLNSISKPTTKTGAAVEVNPVKTLKGAAIDSNYIAPEVWTFGSLERIAYRISLEEHVPPRIVIKLIQRESSWSPSAISPGGSVGLMQVKPIPGLYDTSYLLNPKDNIRAGVAYLHSLENQFSKYPEPIRLGLALASYNCGIGNVERALKHSPPIKTWADFSSMANKHLPVITQHYVTAVEKPISI